MDESDPYGPKRSRALAKQLCDISLRAVHCAREHFEHSYVSDCYYVVTNYDEKKTAKKIGNEFKVKHNTKFSVSLGWDSHLNSWTEGFMRSKNDSLG